MRLSDADLAAPLGAVPQVTWSAAVLDARPAGASRPTIRTCVLLTASIGKVLLLAEVAAQLVAGTLRLDELLVRAPQDVVADSGLWQHLTQQSLSVPTWRRWSARSATNPRDERAAATGRARRGGGAYRRPRTSQHRAARLGPRHAVRRRTRRCCHRERRPKLAAVMAAQWAGAREGDDAALLLLGWLANGADLSMVAAGLGLDPLAHGARIAACSWSTRPAPTWGCAPRWV